VPSSNSHVSHQLARNRDGHQIDETVGVFDGGGVRQVSEAMLIEQVVDRLATSYPEVSRDDIAQTVAIAHDRFQHSTIREFVPLFVERRARAELSRSGSLLVWSS
jgi:hypothetical protein